MRNLIEATFMSLDGVIDAPKLVEEAQPYWLSHGGTCKLLPPATFYC